MGKRRLTFKHQMKISNLSNKSTKTAWNLFHLNHLIGYHSWDFSKRKKKPRCKTTESKKKTRAQQKKSTHQQHVNFFRKFFFGTVKYAVFLRFPTKWMFMFAYQIRSVLFCCKLAAVKWRCEMNFQPRWNSLNYKSDKSALRCASAYLFCVVIYLSLWIMVSLFYKPNEKSIIHKRKFCVCIHHTQPAYTHTTNSHLLLQNTISFRMLFFCCSHFVAVVSAPHLSIPFCERNAMWMKRAENHVVILLI